MMPFVSGARAAFPIDFFVAFAIAVLVASVSIGAHRLAVRSDRQAPEPAAAWPPTGTILPVGAPSDALAPSPSGRAPFRAIVAYALDEDLANLPPRFASFAPVDRAGLEDAFDASTGDAGRPRFLFLSRHLLRTATREGDAFLHDVLWRRILEPGHGLFVFDATSEDVATTLDLTIAYAKDAQVGVGEMPIGVGVRAYRAREGRGHTPPIPPSRFATFAFASRVGVVDAGVGEAAWAGPDYGSAHALAAILAAETTAPRIAATGHVGASPGHAQPRALAGTYGRLVVDAFGSRSPDGTVGIHRCAWGMAGWIDAFYGPMQPEGCDWRPSLAEIGDMRWVVQASMLTMGSGTPWRPTETGTWASIGEACVAAKDAMLAYRSQERIAARALNTLVDDTAPHRVEDAVGPVDVAVGIGWTSGAALRERFRPPGEAWWTFDGTGADLRDWGNMPISGHSDWERTLDLGPRMEARGGRCEDRPRRGELEGARGTAGHGLTVSSPGEIWSVFRHDGKWGGRPFEVPHGDFTLAISRTVDAVGFMEVAEGRGQRAGEVRAVCWESGEAVVVAMGAGGRLSGLGECGR